MKYLFVIRSGLLLCFYTDYGWAAMSASLVWESSYTKTSPAIDGKMDKICEFCGSKKFKGETLSMCCKGGKIKLSSLQVPPPELFSYMSGETPESKHFLQSIRRYNACFQMT